jgi:hypothetical protein
MLTTCATILAALLATGAVVSAELLSCPTGAAAAGGAALKLAADKRSAVLSNGYVCVVLVGSSVAELRSDFHGKGAYGANALAQSFGLDVPGGLAPGPGQPGEPGAKILESRGSSPEARVVTMELSAHENIIKETWTISVGDRQRGVSVSIDGSKLGGVCSKVGGVCAAPRHVIAAVAVSTFAQFERGAMQMMNRADGSGQTLYTNNTLSRVYWLGAKNTTRAARAIPRPYPTTQLPCLDVTVSGTSYLAIVSAPDTEVRNQNPHSSNSGRFERSAGGSLLDFVPGSRFPPLSIPPLDTWTDEDGLEYDPKIGASRWKREFVLTPNNYDFPAGTVAVPAEADKAGLPFDDLRAFYTAIYASPAGQLISFFPATPGMSQTSLHSPNNGYAGLVNFFDPDNFFTVSALALSGDAYLLNEAKKIVMTTGDHIKADGQVPRKIDNSFSTPQAIFDPFWSGSPFGNSSQQRGNGQWSPLMPINIHWILAALNCAKNDVDVAWLAALWPKIELATEFLLRMIQGPPHTCYNSIQSCPAPDPNVCNETECSLGIGSAAPAGAHCSCAGGAPFVRGGGGADLPYLLSTTGSLMNIPLRRGNFTSDTNIYMVHFLREMADASTALGHPAKARELLSTAGKISAAVNEHLWSKDDGEDHYITQLNHDGTTADYVDYAANTMAIFTGVASPERAAKIVARMAKGNCTGAGKRGTWVSERPFYSYDKDKLFPDKHPEEQGDSTSAEGRVALMDAKARIAMAAAGDAGALAYFNDDLLGPIQRDLLEFTWLTERYTCEGLRERTPFFFEYPCLLSMMLKEMKYGIDLGLVEWRLQPTAGVAPFVWAIGTTNVSHSTSSASVEHPGSGARQVTVSGLKPSSSFVATTGCGSSALSAKGVTTTKGIASWNATEVKCGVSITVRQSVDTEASRSAE